jgi:type II secretion system protein G
MKKGFTLIELLIVVAIIGIIAAIAIPQLVDYIQRSRCERTEGDARTIGGSLGAYYTDYGEYPDTGVANMIACLEAGHLKQVPDGDGWNNPWVYTAVAVGGSPEQEYSLQSFAKDGAAGPIATKENINPNDVNRHNYDVIIFCGQFTSNCR